MRSQRGLQSTIYGSYQMNSTLNEFKSINFVKSEKSR